MAKPKKRTRREWGRIRQASGRYLASYQHNGIIYKAPHTFGTKLDAEGFLSETRRHIDLGTWLPPEAEAKKKADETYTVRDLCTEWLDKALTTDAEGNLRGYKESTKQSHLRKLNSRVLCESFDDFDSLADIPIIQVDEEVINRWWQQVNAAPRWQGQRNTNVQAYKRLSTAFKWAVENKKIAVSPVHIKGATKLPKPDLRDRPRISKEQATKLADSITPRLRIGVQLMLWSGLRLGELLELRRKDISVKGGVMTISVRRNAQRVKDPVTKKQVMVALEPKTPAALRTIELPKKIAKELKQHAKKYMAPGEDALVITTEAGKQMMDTNFRSRFNTAAAKAGRPDITPHDCRRFHATMLIKSGRPLDEAQRLMGHETAQQLMEYLRAEEDYRTQAAAALDRLI